MATIEQRQLLLYIEHRALLPLRKGSEHNQKIDSCHRYDNTSSVSVHFSTNFRGESRRHSRFREDHTPELPPIDCLLTACSLLSPY